MTEIIVLFDRLMLAVNKLANKGSIWSAMRVMAKWQIWVEIYRDEATAQANTWLVESYRHRCR